MVDVRGNLRLAFSTIFAPHENFEPKDLKLDNRFFAGKIEEKMVDLSKITDKTDKRVIKAVNKLKDRVGEKRLAFQEREGPLRLFLAKKGLSKKNVKKIIEQTQVENLGLFLEFIDKDPKLLAEKMGIENQNDLLDYMKMARDSLETLKDTIKDPPSIVKKAILMAFQLFQIPKENIKIYTGDDGELLYIDQSREFSIAFKANDNIDEMEYLDFVEDNKKHGFEVDWCIFNVDDNRWMNILQKVAVIATTSALQYVVPRIGATVGALLKKIIKEKTDELLVAGCNMDIRLIFRELLRTNVAIEYIKFQRFEANLYSDEEKKTILKEYGNQLVKSPELVVRGTDILDNIGDFQGLK